MKRWIVPVAGAGLAVALLGTGVVAAVDDGPKAATAQSTDTTAPGAATTGGRTISVDGVGVVSGTPDTVTLSLGVQVQGATASAALASASTKAQSLIDTLTGAGVGKADVQTGYVSVYPRYRDMSQDIDGYWASNALTAVVHDVSKAGAIIDAATAAVGDGATMGGVSFSIDDTSGLYAQARQIAVDQARQHAEQLAKAANVAVGAVVAIDESAQEVPTPIAYSPSATSVAGADSAAPPIEPGRQELRLSVKVVFALTA